MIDESQRLQDPNVITQRNTCINRCLTAERTLPFRMNETQCEALLNPARVHIVPEEQKIQRGSTLVFNLKKGRLPEGLTRPIPTGSRNPARKDS